MRIIQTFWSGGKNLLHNAFGWYAAPYHLMGWALSCILLKEHYDDIELYTDQAGYDMLIGKLKLPYKKVHVVFNSQEFPKELWALAKIKTYALQKEPFIHVDGDVFIFDAFKDQLLQAPVIAQNDEQATDYYKNNFAKILAHLDHVPDLLQFDMQSSPICAYNTGIIGGNQLDFFKRYTDAVLQFTASNDHHKIPTSVIGNYNIIFEQILFYRLCNAEGIKASCYFGHTFDDYGYRYEDIADFTAVPHNVNYLHLLGPLKRQFIACDLMARTLMSRYPTYFSRVVALFPPLSTFKNSFADPESLRSTSATSIVTDKDPGLAIRTMVEQFAKIQPATLVRRDKDSLLYARFYHLSSDRQLQQHLIADRKIHIIETNGEYTAIGNNTQHADASHPGFVAIAYVPEAYFQPYQQVFLDALEFNIMLLLKKQTKFAELLDTLQTCFEDEDVQVNKDSFYELILTSVSMLITRKCIKFAKKRANEV